MYMVSFRGDTYPLIDVICYLNLQFTGKFVPAHPQTGVETVYELFMTSTYELSRRTSTSC